MQCPICGRCWNYESARIKHVIDKHFRKPKGRFIAQLPINGRMERCYFYSLVCWCGFDAFDKMCPPFIKSDFSMAKIAATLHLERCGGPEKHWLDWRLAHMEIRLPPHLQTINHQVKFTAEGGLC